MTEALNNYDGSAKNGKAKVEEEQLAKARSLADR